jgi:hypothetical protein
MAQVISAVPMGGGRSLPDRVREVARKLGCNRVWARALGPHVLVGLGEEEAFARVTPLGDSSFGLAFRDGEAAPESGERVDGTWAPMLLIDGLSDVIEHALVAEGALALEAAGM